IGDLETKERGAVLLLKCLHPAASVEHDGGQRIGVPLLGRGEGAVDDRVGLVKTDRSHARSLSAGTTEMSGGAMGHKWPDVTVSGARVESDRHCGYTDRATAWRDHRQTIERKAFR